MPVSCAPQKTDPIRDFDPDLLQRLQAQHVTLHNVLDRIALAAESGHYAMLRTGLAILFRCLREHTQLEHRELYPYLQWRSRKDARAVALLQSVQAGIGPMESALRAFVERHLRLGVDSGNITGFLEQLQLNSERLRARLLLEEHSLFPQYREIDRIA